MKLDYLNGTPYSIEQPKQMYHFNSDTELLGRFMRLKAADCVLDIGCNTGALLCYAAIQHPASLFGIDLLDDVIDQAKKNLALNQIKAELTVCPVQKYQPEHLFSVIVCNPPYFPTENEDLKNDNPYRSAARHESYLNLSDLFRAVSRLIEIDGAFYLVHRADRLEEILQTAAHFELVPVRMRKTYKKKEGSASGVLICFMKGHHGEMVLDPPVYLDDRSTFENTKGEGR